jgi:DNA-directed RNA polymerase subunit RPC12/RpoP
MTKCPNCGAELRFSPEKQMMVCEYCMSDFLPEELSEAEKPVTAEQATPVSQTEVNAFEEEVRVYSCDFCGAQIIADGNTAATECYYCHNPVTLSGRLTGEYRPDKLIPFKITRNEAEEIFRKYIKGKWFVPGSFKKERQLERMAGVYTPFWLADCKTSAAINAEAKIIHSHTHGNVTITNTKVFECDRAAYMNYERIPADGSKKLDDDFMDSVEPFNYDEMTDFNMSYLAGFFADKYDVGKNEVIPRIRSRAADSAEEILRSDITGYTSVSVKNRRFNIIRTDWQYVMFPLWFMTYLHNGKYYQFAVNGQTGKVAGIPPLSMAKYFIAIAAALVIPPAAAILLNLAGFIG